MYHYTECGLPNIYLKNGVLIEHIDGEEYSSIIDIDNLHKAIAQTLINKHSPLSNLEFKFLRIELNLSQKILGQRFGISEQTIARYEKGQSEIPRTTDAALRILYMESIKQHGTFGYLLDLLADTEAKAAEEKILLEEKLNHWDIVV